MDAAYDLNDLIKACGKNNHVKVLGKAQESADSDFGLYTEQAVRDFINDGGLGSYIGCRGAGPDNRNAKIDLWQRKSFRWAGYGAGRDGTVWFIGSDDQH